MPTIFRPDADPETTSVDGYVEHSATGGTSTWSDLTGGVGTASTSTSTSLLVSFSPYWVAPWVTNLWRFLRRGIALFDTSEIPDDIEILSATLSLFGSAYDRYDRNNASLNVYSVDPDSNTELIAADYTTLGTTAYCDTAIDIASWVDDDWNDFVLNDVGIAAILKTGITKFGLRIVEYDVEGTTPTWWADTSATGFFLKPADYSDGSYAPKLTVTWIAVPTVTTQAVTEIHILYALGNGNITATGGENADKRGICWKLTSGPTVADEYMEDTDSFSTGAFTSWITPTLPETLYYVKAYAHNSEGYGYGDEVTFTAYAQDGGYIWIETTKFHFIDELGTEQDLDNFDQDLNTTDSVEFSEILLTPKTSSSGAEGTTYYDSDDDHLYLATEV